MNSRSFLWIAQNRCGLEKDRPVVAGVSGGSDSLCLLTLLVENGFSVIVAHLDHRLRPESAQDAEFVWALVGRLGLPFVREEIDVNEYARRHSLSVEEAARNVRYEFLFRTARRAAAQAVAVGHTADDQVETVLMHLLRGSGISGLKGMTYRTIIPQWDPEIPLVRPILHLWRADTVRCCQEAGIEPLEDATNQETTYYRNRLRHELVPLLETYNPQAKEHIARMAEILAGDHALLEEMTRDALEGAVRSRGKDFIGLSVNTLRALPDALVRRVWRAAILELAPGIRDIDFQSVERAVAFVREPTETGRIDLLQNFTVRLESDILYLARSETIRESEWPQLESVTESLIPIPGRLDIGSGWVLMAEELDCPPDGISEERLKNLFHAWLDADALTFPLFVRPRRPGDRFQPLGMRDGTTKISSYFTNRKLPRPARDRWPLVLAGDTIAWVPGFAPAEWARIRPETQRIVHIWLSQKKE